MKTYEQSTKDGSTMRRYVVLGALMSSLVACAATAPTGNAVAMGPIGPGSESTGKDAPVAGLPPPPPTSSTLPADRPPPNAERDPKLKQGDGTDEGGGMGYRENPNEADGDAVWSLTISVMRKREVAPPPKPISAVAPPKSPLVARGASRSDLSSNDAAAAPAPPPSGESSGTAGTGGRIGAANEVRGSIDKAEVQRVIRSHLNEVTQCYDQGLSRQPDLEGRVAVKITIGRTGLVVSATKQDSTLPDRLVEQCIQTAVKSWTFPKPGGDGDVTIVYPFILKTTN